MGNWEKNLQKTAPKTVKMPLLLLLFLDSHDIMKKILEKKGFQP